MRKLLTITMVAGAALTVAACGGTATNTTKSTTNTTTTELGNDVMMDANAMDMGMDTNMGMNAMPPAAGNTSTTTTNSTTTTTSNKM